jgi:hypothetical protein
MKQDKGVADGQGKQWGCVIQFIFGGGRKNKVYPISRKFPSLEDVNRKVIMLDRYKVMA